MTDTIKVYYYQSINSAGLTVRVPAQIASKLGLRNRQTVNHETLLKIQAEQKREREKQN